MRIIKPRRNNDEAKLQALFAGWLDSQGILFNASVSAVKVPMATAIKMKRAGYKPGYPDIFIYCPRGIYHGLAIELKAKGGDDKNKNQLAWQSSLQVRGYKALIMPVNLELLEGLKWLQDEVVKYFGEA